MHHIQSLFTTSFASSDFTSLCPPLVDDFIRQDSNILPISTVFRDNGYECYIVGGAIRDYFLDIEISDIDFATNAPPHIVQKLFKRTVPTGIKHGTITILENNKSYETTTYRSDITYKDYRHAKVQFHGTITDDLARRDFTCNAMALDPITGRFFDPYGGKIACRNGNLVTVRKARERYSEDALRMLRALRFCATKSFFIRKAHLRTIQKLHPLLVHVSIERKRDELLKLLEGKSASKGLSYLHKTQILKNVFGLSYTRSQFKLLLRLLVISSPNAIERLALCVYMAQSLFGHANTPSRCEIFLTDLRLTNNQKKHIMLLIKVAQLNYTRVWSNTKIRVFLCYVSKDPTLFCFVFILSRVCFSKSIQNIVLETLKRTLVLQEQEGVYTLSRLALSGSHILKYNHTIRAREIGNTLRYLLRNVLHDPSRNTTAQLQALLRKK